MFDRYVVLQSLGRGGAGEVYAAYDTTLDRKVALKLLRPGGDATATLTLEPGWPMLVREARMLAKLNHPGVVTVYDVGTVGDRAFLAMELVDGIDLASWIQRHRGPQACEPAPLTDGLRLMAEAGRGLAAAHEAGLVHGDFKPANVLVGTDQHARVTDFGIARLAEPNTLPSSPDASGDVSGRSRLIGTPAYMAPEQLGGAPPEVASDVYAFCTSLYEMVSGTRPFAANTPTALAMRKAQGLADLPSTRDVPRWMRAILERGLAADPQRRYSDMSAVLAELQQGMHRGRRRLFALGGATALAVTGLAMARAFAAAPSLCDDQDDPLAGVWDEPSRTAVRQGIERTGHPAAAATVTRLEQTFDAYTERWRDHYDTTCRATADDPALKAPAFACLRRRRVELETLVDVLQTADRPMVERAVAASTTLRSIDHCRDPQWLSWQVEPPADAEQAARVDALRSHLAAARAQWRTGKFDEAARRIEPIVDEAEALAYAPLLAEALGQRGNILEDRGAYTQAAADLERAFFLAQEVHDHAVAADAAVALVDVTGSHLHQTEVALRWARHARLALREAGLAEQALLNAEGSVYRQAARPREALERYEQALTELETTGNADPLQEGTVIYNLGNAYEGLGRYEDALRHFTQAHTLLSDALGSQHPTTAMTLVGVGSMQGTLGRFDQALVTEREALARLEALLGREHPTVVDLLDNLAITEAEAGHLEEALSDHREALRLRQKLFGDDDVRVAASHNNLGIALHRTARYEDAAAHWQRALTIMDRQPPPEHPDRANVLNNLGAVYQKLGRIEPAEEALRRALQIREANLESDHPLLAGSRVDLAALLVGTGRPTEAIALLEAALPLLADAHQAETRARARAWLARALWPSGRDRDRARMLADQARHDLPMDSDERAELEAWLAGLP